MQRLPLINSKDETYAKNTLAHYYAKNLIPAEKKTYLADLLHSQGPYLAAKTEDGEPHYFLDAASQIATLGLGFNSYVFMGTAQFLESWTNNSRGKDFQAIVKAYREFFRRKLEWDNTFLTFCHSGAEANEIALGHCYRERENRKAKKILCFEGSFHGRMLLSLFSTANKKKREPFQWPGFESTFAPFPDMGEDYNGEINPPSPEGWATFWDEAPKRDLKVPEYWPKDDLLVREIDALMSIRESLLTEEHFAIIIEPMQCEGGDRYASGRFHSALLLMAKAFNVPLIYDEVQTGFHLGREFFWHKQLDLQGLNGEKLEPSFVTCAKKAQVGLVLSPEQPKRENGKRLREGEYQVGSVIRGYFHALSLDQSKAKVLQIEQKITQRLMALAEKHFDLIENPRANGLALAFDLKDPSKLQEVIQNRFKHGLLYYPAGSKTLRFRMNLAFSDRDLDFLFHQLENILLEVYRGKSSELPKEVETNTRYTQEILEWQHRLITLKSQRWQEKDVDKEEYRAYIERTFKKVLGLDLVKISEDNFDEYKDLIEDLQKRNYEPARQTSLETFERTARAPKSLCLGVKKDGELLGIVFSAPLSANPFERGVRQDPYFGNDDVLYMVDTTIDRSLQGRGLGRTLKYALTLLAGLEGRERIQGRNRDRLAAGMLNINLSLGSYEQNYLREDYQDFEEYRDVYYYTCPLTWQTPKLNLSSALRSPLIADDLSDEFFKANHAALCNKICLSNFVSENYLKHIKTAFDLVTEDLRHGYMASGQGESADKIAKALWWKRGKEKNLTQMIAFEGGHFGEGSFLSRSLNESEDPYFPVCHFPSPENEDTKKLLEKVEKELAKKMTLGVWVEPLQQKTLKPLSYDFLKGLKNLCQKYETPLVYNETASSFYRYDNQNFFPHHDPEIRPDAGFCYLGGQSSLVYMKEENFVEKPLMMISTWDGDEYSLSCFTHSVAKVMQDKEAFFKTREEFQKSLEESLKKFKGVEYYLKNGVGHFSGHVPRSFRQYFEKSQEGHFRVIPTYGAMRKFLNTKKD